MSTTKKTAATKTAVTAQKKATPTPTVASIDVAAAVPNPDMRDLLTEALSFKAKYEELMGQARESAMSRINTELEKLNALGLGQYRLVNANIPTRTSSSVGTGPKRDWRRPPKAYNPDKKCVVCNIVGHDARAHRAQAPNPRPFTQDELAKQNYLPPNA